MNKNQTKSRKNIPIHVEIWIASRILSEQREFFTKKELMVYIEREFEDTRPGISIHISSCCVANKPSNHPSNYNYLYWISRGEYRIYRDGDNTHPDKIGWPSQPLVEGIPVKYRYLTDKYFSKELLSIQKFKEKILYKERKYKQRKYVAERINLEKLMDYEKEAINKTMLMMAYNPSCARIFSNEANVRIKKRIFSIIELLRDIKTQDSFDKTHKDILDDIVANIRNFREKNPSGIITYGQAQKGLNVFLKIYVDWANLPSSEIAKIVRVFLHCPLDSFVMKTLRSSETELHRKYGRLPCDLRNIITYEQYFNWQKLIDEIIERESEAEKRTLIDIIWYLESLKKKDIT